MRRLLLAQRAEKCPGDLRSKIGRKPKNPENVEKLENTEKIEINSEPIKKPIKRQKPKFKPVLTITRTVKNEQARNPNSMIIDTRDSSDEDDENKVIQSIHKTKVTRKRRRSR